MTPDQLKVLSYGSFGYLSAYDLLQWCSPQFLIKHYNVNSNCIQSGCSIAESEVIASLKNRYDLSAELAKVGNMPAAAIAIVTSQIITAINILVPGNNFTAAPVISIVGGGGSGATATAVLNGNTVGSIVVNTGGTLYTSVPQINFTGGQSADTRSNLLVKIISLLAIRNILGNMENISDQMTAMFKWADQTLRDLRNGQQNLPLPGVNICVSSESFLVEQSFKTLG